MTVNWTPSAIEDRKRLLEAALGRALEQEDPFIYRAALDADARIVQEASALDGVATWREGPMPGTRLYVCRHTQLLLVYTREGDDVQIIWVAPAASNWNRSH